MLDILFEIRLARYIIYIKKLNPWRSGDVKTPDEDELADILREEEPEPEAERTLEEELPPPPPPEEESIGKVYSSEGEDVYTDKGYKASRPGADYVEGKEEAEFYKTRGKGFRFFGERVSKEDEDRMGFAEKIIDRLRGLRGEEVKYERNVKKSKKRNDYHY